MTRRARMTAVLAVLATLGAGCADVRERVQDLRDPVDQLTDRARFCLALARTLTAIEAGSPQTAAEAAEEAFAQAPPEIREDAGAVVDAVREARNGRPDALRDPEVEATARRLADAARSTCDPTD